MLTAGPQQDGGREQEGREWEISWTDKKTGRLLTNYPVGKTASAWGTST